LTTVSLSRFPHTATHRPPYSDEAIKWPELNAHGADSHPLPVNSTGRSGFDTGSEPSLSRVPSVSTGFDAQSSSTLDPYAVPPLPHLNPNQPYRDDPSPAPYYDPYRGPVPNTFSETLPMNAPLGAGWTTAEAIPMTQMSPGSRARSPGPQMAYETGRGSPAPGMAGRQSPGPQMAYETGRGSPAPGMAGRQSPGPYAAYGDRSRSPGPAVGMGGMPPGGRRSPGPQAAYDTGYGP
jgi:hypothetical protein